MYSLAKASEATRAHRKALGLKQAGVASNAASRRSHCSGLLRLAEQSARHCLHGQENLDTQQNAAKVYRCYLWYSREEQLKIVEAIGQAINEVAPAVRAAMDSMHDQLATAAVSGSLMCSTTLTAKTLRDQDKAKRGLWTYSYERSNMALGGITPMQKLAFVA